MTNYNTTISALLFLDFLNGFSHFILVHVSNHNQESSVVVAIPTNLLQVRQLEDGTIFLLASLPRETYGVLQVFQLYQEGNVKVPVVARTKQGVGNVQLDCKGINFRLLRNLDGDTVVKLLTRVADGEWSFAEMGKECGRIKKRQTIHQAFVSQLGLSSWEEAMEKYEQFANTASMDQFLGLNFNKGTPQ